MGGVVNKGEEGVRFAEIEWGKDKSCSFLYLILLRLIVFFHTSNKYKEVLIALKITIITQDFKLNTTFKL